MRRTEVLEGVRMMRFRDVFGRCERRELSKLEAAELLGVSERTFRRWCRRFEAEGEAGLHDRRQGKASAKRVPADAAMRVERLYRERYDGFTAKHFHEHLVRTHGFRWGYTWTKTFFHGRGLVMPAPRRGAHRRKRPRRPMAGMMLHQDASKHRWITALEAGFDLVITLDDATSEIYSAFLVDEEGTASTFRALREVFGRLGLPCSLYTDRGSHYFLTPKAGEKPDPRAKTQVGRALAQLGLTTSPPIRRRRAGARSAPSAPCRTGCRRNWTLPGSPTSRRPTASSARFTCRLTTPVSPSPPSSRGSSPSIRRSLPRSCASRRSGWSATTTPSATGAAGCRFRPARSGPTTSGRRRPPLPRRHPRRLPRPTLPRPLCRRRQPA